MQSSNTLFVVQASEIAMEAEQSVPALSAVAQCRSLLNLTPVKTDAVGYLKATLPLWDAEGSEHSKAPTSKVACRSSAPCSVGEFEKAWMDVCAFEWLGQAWIPSPGTQIDVWKAFMNTVIADSMDLNMPFSQDVVTDEDEDTSQILKALLAKIGTVSPAGMVTVNHGACIRWFGRVLLLVHNSEGNGSCNKADVLASWRNLLPEDWRNEADMELLKVGAYTLAFLLHELYI